MAHTRTGKTASKNLKYASANALKLYLTNVSVFHSHIKIHRMAGRAKPEQMCLYRHAIMIYRLFNQQNPKEEFLELNFQLSDNTRSNKIMFVSRQAKINANPVILGAVSQDKVF